jgi:hypothetical protein
VYCLSLTRRVELIDGECVTEGVAARESNQTDRRALAVTVLAMGVDRARARHAPMLCGAALGADELQACVDVRDGQPGVDAR